MLQTFVLLLALSTTASDGIVAGLDRPITIELDLHAVPTVQAHSALDAMVGQGFMHGSERFFQMDLTRRHAAGELSELIGAFGVEIDRPRAVLFRRQLAARIVKSLPQEEQIMLDRYADGVNAGLASLDAAPIEYLNLGLEPAPWQPEDTILVAITMTDMLARHDGNEHANAALDALVGPTYAEWLMMQTSPYDALLIAPTEPEVVPVAPSPDEWTSRRTAFRAPLDVDDIILGSNNFAVAGSRTVDGRAILANDPHLMISAPAIWYRCRLEWPDHLLLGLSLPGVPGVVIGTNGHVAFGMTNTTGDFRDHVIIDVDPNDPTRYQTPDGWEPFNVRNVSIRVRGSEDVVVESRWTRWGPVLAEDSEGRPLSVLSVPWQPGGVNVALHRMADAMNVDDAVEVIRQWNGPSQNVLLADSSGRIAWIVSGWLPNRIGYDGRVPVSLTDGSKGWFGQLPEAERPVVIDPEEGFLFTANSRTLPLEQSSRIGSAFANPCRAYRIRQDVLALDVATERDLLAIQLDDYAQMLAPYRPLYLEGLRALPSSQARDRAVATDLAWDGRATLDTLALAPLDRFRSNVIRAVRSALLSGARGARLRLASSAVRENAVLAALDQRPAHLHPDGKDGWVALLADAAKETIGQHATPWGEVNRSTFRHPLAMASPAIGSGFDLPSTPQSGYRGSPRVAAPTYGASARIIVSPNHLEDAILQTPGGQSGDPFSPHYRDFHESWLQGTPEPLVPGAPEIVFQLNPS